MFKKECIWYFTLMFLPMLIVSTLGYISYSITTQDFIQINWLIVFLIAVILDVFITLLHTRKKGEKKPE